MGVLRDAISSPIRFGTTVDTIESAAEGVRMRLTDGTVEEADLLVGADGVHSRVRELAFGSEQRFARYLGYHVAAFSAQDTGLSERIGERYQMRTTPNRMVGCYAVGEGGFASFFLYRDENWDLPNDPAAALRTRFGGLGWAPSTRWRIVVRDWMFRLAGLPFVRRRMLDSVLPPTGNVLDRPQQDRALS